MSKVKITKQQAEAIEELRSKRFPDSVIAHNVACDNYNSRVSRSEHDSLCKMKFDDLIKALYIGYEIEPEYKVGDWVRYWKNDCLAVVDKITEIRYDNGEVEFDHTTFTRFISDITRRATPEEIAEEKERRWWAKHGRQIDEIRPNDVLINTNDTYFNARIVESVHEKGNVKFKGNEGYSPRDLIKQSYKVVCFAEDRKDE